MSRTRRAGSRWPQRLTPLSFGCALLQMVAERLGARYPTSVAVCTDLYLTRHLRRFRTLAATPPATAAWASNQRPLQGALEGRGDYACDFGQDFLTLVQTCAATVVESSDDDRRAIGRPDDSDVIRLITPGARLVSDAPAGWQTRRKSMLTDLRVDHPTLQAGPGVSGQH